MRIVNQFNQAALRFTQKVGLSNLMILGGLMYSILSLIAALIEGEPNMRFAFNILCGITGICIGLLSKARSLMTKRAAREQ